MDAVVLSTGWKYYLINSNPANYSYASSSWLYLTVNTLESITL